MSNAHGGNLVKSFFLSQDGNEPRVIDTNSIIEEKLRGLRGVAPASSYTSDYSEDMYGGAEEFTDGLDAQTLDALVGDPGQYGEEGYEGDGSSGVIKANSYSDEDGGFSPLQPEVLHEAPAYDGPDPNELLAQVQAEIEDMKRAAEDEIEQLKSMAYEEGKSAGYNEGKAIAEAELSGQRAAVEQERQALMQQYEEMVDDLEPRFVHTLTSIYEKIFEVDLSGHRELIMGLLRSAMAHIDRSKNYLIHVSRDDHPYVSEHKEELLATLGDVTDVVIDIVEDITMKSGDCMIETPDGIFDCSLDTELAALRKKLELLSYTPD